MKDEVMYVFNTGKFGLHVAHDKALFKRVFASISGSLLKYEGVLPGDWLSIHVEVSREVKPRPKPTQRQYDRDFEKLKADMKRKRAAT